MNVTLDPVASTTAADCWHVTNARLLSGQVPVILAGCGGTGSQVLTGLARLDRALRALEHPGGLHVTVYDPDRVSEANVGRQLFASADVGANKGAVLVHRVNTWYGLDWEAVPAAYGGASAGPTPLILITCVDTARARRRIHRARGQLGLSPAYWLDLGNRQGDGQVILGEPAEARAWRTPAASDGARLPTVVDLYPDLLDPTVPEDDRPSCSLAEALEEQDLFINLHVAAWGLELLWRLFRDGGIRHHGAYISLTDGRVNPLPVPPRASASEEVTP